MAAILSPLSFVASTLLIYWSGWPVNEILIPIFIVAWVGYALLSRKSPTYQQDIACSWWLLAYYIAMLILSKIGTFDGLNLFSTPIDMIIVTIVALICYYWGAKTSIAKPIIVEE